MGVGGFCLYHPLQQLWASSSLQGGFHESLGWERSSTYFGHFLWVVSSYYSPPPPVSGTDGETEAKRYMASPLLCSGTGLGVGVAQMRAWRSSLHWL